MLFIICITPSSNTAYDDCKEVYTPTRNELACPGWSGTAVTFMWMLRESLVSARVQVEEMVGEVLLSHTPVIRTTTSSEVFRITCGTSGVERGWSLGRLASVP
jgi:hypothetical protein